MPCVVFVWRYVCFVSFSSFRFSFKLRPFVQSLFDVHAPRQSHAVNQQLTACVPFCALFLSCFLGHYYVGVHVDVAFSEYSVPSIAASSLYVCMYMWRVPCDQGVLGFDDITSSILRKDSFHQSINRSIIICDAYRPINVSAGGGC